MGTLPRIYRIHQKSLLHHHHFEIDKDNDEIEYIVRPSPSLLSKGMFLCQSSTGKELIKIHKEKVHLHVSYDISKVDENNDNDQHLGTVRRIHDQHSQIRFEITSIYGVYRVEHTGCPFDRQFKLITGNKIVVDITNDVNLSKQENSYHVQIYDDDGGDLFLLSLVIAIWSAQRFHLI